MFFRVCDEVKEWTKRASEQSEHEPRPNVSLLSLGVLPHPHHDQRQGDDQIDEDLHRPQAVRDRPKDARKSFEPNGGYRECPKGHRYEQQEWFEHARSFQRYDTVPFGLNRRNDVTGN